MRVTVHLHGPLRVAGDQVELLPDAPADAAGILECFFMQYPELAQWQSCTRVAQGMEYLSLNTPILEAAEVHLIPPVSGG